ncbi:MFS transporter [Caballeronia sp. BR00000012568055]|uniref:MFS transporter n=1 Tax=Caballeronia sp. BR00000012568055 TaxID=2918761 RepID=UPI0023F94796|nr:MFS transporter [Caballeronia sp. BR00000012568055]
MRRSISTREAGTTHRTFAAAAIGNLLEIYDFIAYGIFAVPISRTFFATHSELISLLLTFLTFAVGFIARPVGALVLGRYADRVGRRRALSLTLILMAASTAVLAVCPSYASIGLAAPVIITLGRLLQGFSAGGEVGGAVAMLVENAPESKKNFASSFQQMSQGGGALLAGLVGLALTHVFTDAQIAGGAWRLAFVFGLLIGPVGWYIRRSVPETVAFEAASRERAPALLPTLASHRWQFVGAVAIMVFWTIATYVSNYFTTYAVRELHLPLSQSYLGQLSYGVVMVVMCPIIGHLSDRIGVRKPMLFGATLTALFAYPLFWLLAHQPGPLSLMLVQACIGFLLACYAACASNVLASIFPTRFRATGVGFAYAIGVTVFGGLTPLAVTSLIDITGDKLVIGYYLSAAAVVSCIAVWLTAPHRDKPKHEDNAATLAVTE